MSNLYMQEFTKFWCYVKGKPETIDGVWDFKNGLQVDGCNVITTCDLPRFNDVVYITNVDQSIDGNKTFLNPLVVPNAIANNQAVNLGQLLNAIPPSGNYIDNQTSSPQSAGFYIIGTGLIGGTPTNLGAQFGVQSSPTQLVGSWASVNSQMVASPISNTSATFYGDFSESGTTIGTLTYANIIGRGASVVNRGRSAITSSSSYIAKSPFFTGTGTTINNSGFIIEPQFIYGVTNGYGIQQQGLNDVNSFMGNTGFGTSTPTSLVHVVQPSVGTGAISFTNGSGAVVGTGTQFLNTFKIGDVITSTDSSETRTISAITDNTHLTTDNWTHSSHLLPPVLNQIGISNVSGTFTPTTYYYVITAVNGAGETTKSNELSIAVSGTQSVFLDWTTIQGYVSINIYRGTVSGTYTHYLNTTNYQQFIDTGTTGGVGTPPVSNTAIGVTPYTLIGGTRFQVFGNGNIKLPKLTSGTPISDKYLALDSNNNIILTTAGSGSGTVTAVTGVNTNGFTWSIATNTTTPAITLTLQNATSSQNGQLTSADWNTFNNKQSAGSYLTANQTITLSGDISGTGTTAITTIIGTAKVGISNLSASGTPSSSTYLRGDNIWTTISSGGVTTIGAFSGSSQINGANISGSTITFGPADDSNPGMVTIGTQTFAGIKTFTTPVFIGLPTGTGVSNNGTASTLAAYDISSNISANNFNEGWTTTTTTAGTTILTVTSANQQYFTGTTTQTVLLPVVSTLVLGLRYRIVNNSTGIVTVQSSGGNIIQAMDASSSAIFTVILTTGTTTVSWDVAYYPTINFLLGTFNGSGTVGSPYYLNIDTTPTSGSSLPVTSNGVWSAIGTVSASLANYVTIAAPQLTTSSISGYAWIATDTAGHGSWQAVGGATIYSGDGTLGTNRTITMGGNTLTFVDTSPSLIVANTSFPTSKQTWLGVVSPVYGVLGLSTGSGGFGYIASGGTLQFNTNNTNGPGFIPNGTIAMSMSSGTVTFPLAVSFMGGFSTNTDATVVGTLTTGPAAGGQYMTTPNGGTQFVYQTLINTGGTAYFGLSNSSGGGFIGGSGAYAMILSAPANLVFGTALTNRMQIFNATGNVTVASNSDDGVNKFQVYGTGVYYTTALAATPTDGLGIKNTTASTSGVPVQISPNLHLGAQVWNTTATAANNWTDWITYVKPVSGTTPTSSLIWASSLTSTLTPSYTSRMTLDNSGNLTLLTGNLNITALIASKVVFTDASKNLTSVGIGSSSQYIAGDGSLFTIGSKLHTIFTPTTGGTVALVNNQYNIINPSGALLALTVNLPSFPANNDSIYIKFTQNVTTVTYGNGTVVDGITAPTAGGLTVLVYDSGTTSWY